MKKIVYIVMALAMMITGATVASADQVTVPASLHAGTGDYTMINIRNAASQVVQISVQFNTNLSASTAFTSNTATAVNKTASIPGNGVWTLLTRDSDIYATTTSVKRAQIVIQSSATAHPYAGGVGTAGAGPIAVNAMFVHIEAGAHPSGFSYPSIYRTRTWVSGHPAYAGLVGNSGAPGLVGSLTVDNWEQ